MMFSFVVAAPPVFQSTQNGGIQVEFPNFDYLEIDQPHTFQTHLYNISDGLPIPNAIVSCTHHIFNESGIHIVEVSMVADNAGLDFESLVLGGNFSTAGEYTSLISCNTTTIGGFASNVFVVNADGQEYGVAYAIISSGVLLLLMFLFAMLVGGTRLLPQDSCNDNNEILQVSMLKHLRWVFYAVAYVVAMAIFFISSNVSLAFFGSEMMGKFLFVVFQVMFYGIMIVLPLTIIKIYVDFFKSKDMRMMIERGIPVGKGL